MRPQVDAGEVREQRVVDRVENECREDQKRDPWNQQR
jgi:hypothetical protein